MFTYLLMYLLIAYLTAPSLCSYMQGLRKTTVKFGQNNPYLTDLRNEDTIPHATLVLKGPFLHASWNICNYNTALEISRPVD
jgi:hypothetical protein